MPFIFIATELPGLFLIEPMVFPDERGFFIETYKQSEFVRQGITDHFVQANHSRSSRGTLRGLHFQNVPQSQAKLISSLHGEIYDVAVDIRRGSPTFGKWQAVYLSAENRRMLYVPAGFAHGFCVISETADISYMTSAEYAPALEGGIVWNDADLKIPWPIDHPQLSKRDRDWPRLREINSQFPY